MNKLTGKLLNDIFEYDDSEKAFNRFKLFQLEIDECYFHPEKYYFMKKSKKMWMLFLNPKLFNSSLLELIRQEFNKHPHFYSGYFDDEPTQLFALGDCVTFPEIFDHLKDNVDEYIKRYYRYSYDK